MRWLGPQIQTLFVLSLISSALFLVPPCRCQNVTLTLYYESLCPYCADFIVNHMVKIFENGLISVVDLKLVPWGNAWISSDGSAVCQHGSDECVLNTIEACTIAIYPDVYQQYSFIYCVERLTLENRHNEWTNCLQSAKLSKAPIDCYTSGYGKKLERKYAVETAKLNPPHRFVPWVVVNNQPLQEDFNNFDSYICKAYKSGRVPEACKSIQLSSSSLEKPNPISPVCYAIEDKTKS